MQNQTNPKPSGAPMAKLVLVAAMIVCLGALFGAVGYLAKNKQVKISQPQVLPAAEQEAANQIIDETTDWKTYRNEEYGFEVKYPTNVLKISQKDGYINLFHSISFEHENSCDFGQENALSILKELTDFNIDIKMENSRLLNAIRAKEGENISKYIVGNLLKTEEGYIEEIKIAQFKGYRIINVFEGCGADSYYFSINDGKTLFVRRKHIAELILNPQRYSSAEGVIMSQESDVLFDQILSTFKLIEKDETANWKTYRNEEYGLEFKYPKDWTISERLNGSIIMLRDLYTTNVKNGTYKGDLPDSITVRIYENIAEIDSKKIGSTSLKDFLDKYSTLSDPVYENIMSQKISSLDGYAADAGPNQFGGGRYFFMELPNKQVVSFWLFNEKTDQETMNQILSTFKFTEK